MMYEINYDKTHNLLVLKLVGFSTGEQHNQAWLDVVNRMQETKADKCLVDAVEQKVVTLESQKWIKNELLPIIENLTKDLPYKVKIARLDSQDIFNQASAQTFLKLVKSNNYSFDYQGFSSHKIAYNWLMGEK